jgi:hypothetical protein
MRYARCPRMTHPIRLLAVVAAMVLTLAFAPRPRAGKDDGRLPTAAELRQMRDAGQYHICLQQIGRVLRLGGGAGKGYDRYDLLLLRGDCLLHLEDPATAKLAFAAAAQSPVAEQARAGRATALLIQRSTKMTSVPRVGNDTGDGINIASAENRTKAMAALLRDELRASEADINRATAAEDLVPIQQVLPKLADLYAVERTASGGDASTRPILKAVGERARTLIDRELGLQEQATAGIQERANQHVAAPAVAVAGGGAWWWGGGDVRRGLYTDDRRELRDLIDYLLRIEETVKMGRQIALSFDGDTKPWDPLIDRASKVVQHAQDVLEAE